jgi:hypothetical protein
MKSTLVVLALAALSAAGCRAIGTNGGCGCGQPMCDGYGCGDTCGESYGDPCCGQPGCGGACGRGGCLEDGCQGGCCAGGNCGLFDRYCGHNCGPGYGPGPYDCSPCNSPNWGCNGYRHPHGFVGGHECQCENCQRTAPIYAGVCGNGYCCCVCGQPGPACCCNSGDHNYNFTPGPPVAQTAYPYYTVRGPRDFLLDNPPPLGPY